MKIKFIMIGIIFTLFTSGCQNKIGNDNIKESTVELNSIFESEATESTTEIIFESESTDNITEYASITNILQNQDTNSKMEQVQVSERENISDTSMINTAYQKIIDEYKRAVNFGGTYIVENKNDFPNINFTAVMLNAYVARDDRGKFYANDSEFYEDINILYTTYDIDKNGIDELLLFNSKWTANNICDVYSFDGKSAVKLFNDDTLFITDTMGERTTLTIYENGIMYIYASSGAAYGSAQFYKMNDDGYSLDLIKQYEVNGYDYPDTPYYNESEFLSLEEFEKNFSDLIEVTKYNKYNLNSSVITKQ